jgi:predicted 3-demethylubiquinone-9 3-methyltransferase (glyoxalase superfamily)
MQKITPFLWFDGQAEEAMNFYVSVFPNARAGDVSRNGDTVVSVSFELEGQKFIGLNGGPHFRFTPAISLFVDCETQAEVDDLWGKLCAGGGEPQPCGWLKDRYGLSWQVIPSALGRMLYDKDPAKARRVMEAMMKMTKIDIRRLEQAYAQP